MKGATLLYLTLISLVESATQCYGGLGHEYRCDDPLVQFVKACGLRKSINHVSEDSANEYSPVYVGDQHGVKVEDKITTLTGKPNDVNFDQMFRVCHC